MVPRRESFFFQFLLSLKSVKLKYLAVSAWNASVLPLPKYIALCPVSIFYYFKKKTLFLSYFIFINDIIFLYCSLCQFWSVLSPAISVLFSTHSVHYSSSVLPLGKGWITLKTLFSSYPGIPQKQWRAGAPGRSPGGDLGNCNLIGDKSSHFERMSVCITTT